MFRAAKCTYGTLAHVQSSQIAGGTGGTNGLNGGNGLCGYMCNNDVSFVCSGGTGQSYGYGTCLTIIKWHNASAALAAMQQCMR